MTPARVLPLLVGLLLLLPASAQAQSERERELRETIETLHLEINDLRERMNRLTDEAIRNARRFDEERRRWQEERERLQAENERLRQRVAELEGGEAEPEETPARREALRVIEERQVTLNFRETPLVDVVDFLQAITGLNFAVGREVDADDVAVSLRLRDISLKNALDLIVASEEGLSWEVDAEGVVHIRGEDR